VQLKGTNNLGLLYGINLKDWAKLTTEIWRLGEKHKMCVRLVKKTYGLPITGGAAT